MPWNGERGFSMASLISARFADSAARLSADAAPVVEAELTAPVLFGSAESPMSGLIRSIGMPRASAPSWASTVHRPVPRSAPAVETPAVPSACRRTFTWLGKRDAG
jgi:hypothetical protein